MIEMDQFHHIKYLKEVEGLSQRQIAKKLDISRNTVSKYLKQNTAPNIDSTSDCLWHDGALT